MPTNWAVFPEGTEPPKPVVALAEQVHRDGGHVLALYREPLKEAWQLFVLLPLARVEPTPYQRDLSKPHVKRLQEVIKKLERFVDPIVVAVIVVAVAVVLMQPLLIVALDFVVQNDSINARAAVVKPLGGFQVSAEDLRVVLQFAGPFQTGVEGL